MSSTTTVRIETEGSLLCRAEKNNLAEWKTVFGPYKYDSAIMLKHGADFYVIARRNITGQFLHTWPFLSDKANQIYSPGRYSPTRKRISRYKLDKKNWCLKLCSIFLEKAKPRLRFQNIFLPQALRNCLQP